MSLRDRLRRSPVATPGSTQEFAPVERNGGPQDELTELKRRLHHDLIAKLNFASMEDMDEAQRREQVESLGRKLLAESDVKLTRGDEERLVQDLLHDAFDLGPITPFLMDEEISDVLVNTHRQVYVERLGKLELTRAQFRDEAHLRLIIDRIVSRVGRRLDESSPLVDARLPDGSRVNAIIPPVALDGAILSIRRFRRRALSIENLLELGSLSGPMAHLLRGIVRGRVNVMITGGTGSGKTTLLNILSRYIPNGERIVTIEDSAELQLQQPHVVRLETRPPNIEGKGTITQRELVRNALRMRPDRIVVGEVRGDEVLDMLQAMNTGHDGSLTTLHANGPRDALHRLENLVLMAGHNLPDKAIREQIVSALQVVVHVSRMSDGTRKVLSIEEIVGMEGSVVTMHEIFRFVRTGIGHTGIIQGRYEATGIVPHFTERVELAGTDLSGIFQRTPSQ
ncbi:MAG: CpaF family protein [Candidatus Eisenbacteria bacterium]|uniref:CpaF family protein n=1 Tax=Eiseniibacteriota bacterium TaxID=2212470 RepID=A0A538T5P8_UNCEI|nr:MAG: CpaF family protein [Candidatus Eisenbacteria bacterium]TMQ58794.1 MAG: CpaF family protein [Candidatus Eisenbacteria bacterium]